MFLSYIYGGGIMSKTKSILIIMAGAIAFTGIGLGTELPELALTFFGIFSILAVSFTDV